MSFTNIRLENTANIGLAFTMAVDAHDGHVDKLGKPYIEHVVRVFNYVRRHGGMADEQIVALLHGTVEYTEIVLDDIKRAFGDEIATSVEALTRIPGEPVEHYLARVKADPCAYRVKMADIIDNSDSDRLSGFPFRESLRLSEKYARYRELLRT